MRDIGSNLANKQLINNIETILDKSIEAGINHIDITGTSIESSEIAKELNMRSANEFNKILSDLKIQYKVNNTWVLTAKYSNLGYESIKQNVLDNGKVVYDRKFTQLGRDFILELFKIGGIKC